MVSQEGEVYKKTSSSCGVSLLIPEGEGTLNLLLKTAQSSILCIIYKLLIKE